MGQEAALTSERFSSEMSEPFPSANDCDVDGKVAATDVEWIPIVLITEAAGKAASMKMEGAAPGGEAGQTLKGMETL